MLKTDNNARIEHVISEPRFTELLKTMPGVELRQIEEAVLIKINEQLMLNDDVHEASGEVPGDQQQEADENREIQQMIIQFYSKFDQLHKQSVAKTLAKSPTKEQVKNEIKYKIPERWTKNFHKHDIIPISLYTQPLDFERNGRINKPLRTKKQSLQPLNQTDPNQSGLPSQTSEVFQFNVMQQLHSLL